MSSEGKDKVCLKAIAPRLTDLMRELGNATTDGVVTMLINRIVVENNNSISQDTVKRRIYDVINVLSAAGIIEKSGKKLIWHGLNVMNPKREQADRPAEMEPKPSEKTPEQESLETKEKYLYSKIKRLVLYKTLIQRNTTVPRPENAISLPSIIIGFASDETVKTEKKEKYSLDVTASQPKLYLSPAEILDKLPIEREKVEKMLSKNPLFRPYAENVLGNL